MVRSFFQGKKPISRIAFCSVFVGKTNHQRLCGSRSRVNGKSGDPTEELQELFNKIAEEEEEV